jgi:hypothetical protein
MSTVSDVICLTFQALLQEASNSLTPVELSRSGTPLGASHGNGVSLYAAATAAAAAAGPAPTGTG